MGNRYTPRSSHTSEGRNPNRVDADPDHGCCAIADSQFLVTVIPGKRFLNFLLTRNRSPSAVTAQRRMVQPYSDTSAYEARACRVGRWWTCANQTIERGGSERCDPREGSGLGEHDGRDETRLALALERRFFGGHLVEHDSPHATGAQLRNDLVRTEPGACIQRHAAASQHCPVGRSR